MSPTPTVDIAPSPTSATGLSVTARTIDVTLTEFEIEMPPSVSVGPTTFNVTNAGTLEHNFRIEGPDVERNFDINLTPGESRSMELELIPGTYQVYCPVGDHKQRGMSLVLAVTQ